MYVNWYSGLQVAQVRTQELRRAADRYRLVKSLRRVAILVRHNAPALARKPFPLGLIYRSAGH